VSKQGTPGKPTTRRYTVEEKAQAVRLVRQLRAETGQRHGAVKRVAGQLGYGVESVRNWVLCRRRHNTHYADLRVMPTRVSVSLAGAGGVLPGPGRDFGPTRRSKALRPLVQRVGPGGSSFASGPNPHDGSWNGGGHYDEVG
jgi:hypothetical protein